MDTPSSEPTFAECEGPPSLPDRLPLTSFECFQFWETRADFPNQIVAVLDFEGPFEPRLFVEAVARVLPRHPLLYSRLQLAGQTPVAFGWSAGQPGLAGSVPSSRSNDLPPDSLEKMLADFGLQEYVRLQTQTDDWRPPHLVDVPNLQPDQGPPLCLTIQYNRHQCRWIMQTHHVVCDGLGGLQVVREFLQVYHWLHAEPRPAFPLRPLDQGRLRNRGRLIRGNSFLWARLKRWPMKWIGLFGASKFLWRRPISLARASVPPESEAAQTPVPSPTLWVDGRLTKAQTLRLRQIAKEFGVTVNSLLLAHWLATLHWFRCQSKSSLPQSHDCYRLMIPTNERTGGDVGLSACNQVSMVYVDRWAREMENIDGLAAGIDFEMSVIRKWGLSGTFLLALRLFTWFPGLIRWYARRPNCWATSYVTNLGPIMDRLRVGQVEELSRVGELKLTDVRLLPPLRPKLPAALAVHQYGGQLCLTLHHDPQEISAERATTLLGMFLNRLRTQS